MADNVTVVARFRPETVAECAAAGLRQRDVGVKFDDGERAVRLTVPGGANLAGHSLFVDHSFRFQHVFPPSCTQEQVYETAAEPMVEGLLAGYNAAIVAYGQTGAGKSYTMLGEEGSREPGAAGVMPRLLDGLFHEIERRKRENPNLEFAVSASFVEVYMERVRDLLSEGDEPCQLNIGGGHDGVWVAEATQHPVRTPADVIKVLRLGEVARVTGATSSNAVSSRSHAMFVCTISSTEGSGTTSAQLYCVDLAGSERVGKAETWGLRLDEAKKINQSLLALGNVIAALAEQTRRRRKRRKRPSSSSASTEPGSDGGDSGGEDSEDSEEGCEEPDTPRKKLPARKKKVSRKKKVGGKKKPAGHVPYRDSKLTRMLQHCFGGNSRTVVICCCSPAAAHVEETLSTLRFGDRAATIQNAAVARVQRTPEEMEARLAQLEEALGAARADNFALQQELGVARSAGQGHGRRGRDSPVFSDDGEDQVTAGGLRGLNIQPLLCPLGGRIMAQPVTALDGHAYERDAIEAWWRAHGTVSPATGQKLTARLLLPAHAVRAITASVFPAAVAERARRPPCWLDHLPLEALVCLLGMLPAAGLAAAGQVCREWRGLARHDALWLPHLHRDFELSEGAAPALRIGIDAVVRAVEAGAAGAAEARAEYRERVAGRPVDPARRAKLAQLARLQDNSLRLQPSA
jgi:hypothetical protein